MEPGREQIHKQGDRCRPWSRRAIQRIRSQDTARLFLVHVPQSCTVGVENQASQGE